MKRPAYVIRRDWIHHFARGTLSTREFVSGKPAYLTMRYKGWGNAEPIGWSQNVADARVWSDKSGAYKLLKRRADDIGDGAEVVEKPPTPRTVTAPAESRRLTKKERALGRIGAPERAYHSRPKMNKAAKR